VNPATPWSFARSWINVHGWVPPGAERRQIALNWDQLKLGRDGNGVRTGVNLGMEDEPLLPKSLSMGSGT
jgi:hypothetical protein